MKFSRRSFLGAAVAVPVAVRSDQFAGDYHPQAEQIGDGIWVVRGADQPVEFANGGAIANSVIMDSGAGAIVVDPGPSLAFGKALDALARQLTGKPVGLVYVTHLHPDHALAAGAFDPAILHALPGTRADIERDGEGFSDAMYRILTGWMIGTQVVLPKGDVAEGPADFGGRKLELFALSGHSDADLAILDVASGTLIAGDSVFFDRAPATPQADFALWQAALDRLAAIPHRQLVPGHGPVDPSGAGTDAAIAQTRDWLTWLEGALRAAVASGLDMTEAGEIAIPARFGRVAAARYELQRSVSHFYPRLEEEIFPRIDG